MRKDPARYLTLSIPHQSKPNEPGAARPFPTGVATLGQVSSSPLSSLSRQSEALSLQAKGEFPMPSLQDILAHLET